MLDICMSISHKFQTDPHSGRVLTLTDGATEVICALDFGLRILHLSCVGMPNLFYEQPVDLSDGLCTSQGWRLYGGHRLWCAPESNSSYYPDNIPVGYELLPDGVRLTQQVDPWLKVQKQMTLRFEPDGSILLVHSIKNTSDAPVTLASWGISTLGDGIAEIIFDSGTPGCLNPERVLALWGETCLNDERVTFSKNRVHARHLPRPEEYKIGLYSKSGRAVFQNKAQQFELVFSSDAFGQYPDGGCNFELYLDAHVMELETLGPLCTLSPGEPTGHWERWHVCKSSSIADGV